MGKGGRIACIFTPFGLTIATSICLILIFLGGLQKSSSTLSELYFFRADLHDFHASPQLDIIPGTNVDNELLNDALKKFKTDLKAQNYYSIYLQNYCKSDTKLTSDDNSHPYCSSRKAEFWFNPIEVWGLNNSTEQKLFPKELNKALDTYKTVSKWMYIAYVCALATTLVELVVGLFAICSRWGSFFTTLFSTFSTLFTIAASITSTALFSVLTGSFNTALKPYGIKGSMGRNVFITTWLAVAFSLAAGFFWTLSVCCCSGRSPYGKDAYKNSGHGGGGGMGGMKLPGLGKWAGRGRGMSKRVKVEKTPYTYERVESPYMGATSGPHGHAHGHQDVPMLNLPPGHQDPNVGGAYEPFRHQNV